MIINNKDLKFLCDHKCGGNEIYDGSVNGNIYIYIYCVSVNVKWF